MSRMKELWAERQHDELVAANALSDMLADQWPTLNECMACVDHGHMFRRAVNDECPFCESRSLVNVGAIMARGDA